MEILYAEALGSTNQQYGIAATCAVAFPIALFFRIHFPGQVLTAVMTPVTFGIVIGKSSDRHRLTRRLCRSSCLVFS